jgi:leader peptidase (prepilin peptidase)/N-methyltransferase
MFLHFLMPNVTATQVLFSHIGGAIGIFLVVLVTNLVTKNGIGGGDIKLLAIIPLWVGFTNSLIVLFTSCISFCIYTIINKKELKKGKTIAYVPFIFVGIFAVYIKELLFIL